MHESKNTFWRFSIDRSIVHRGILIEATDKTVEGYHLYGTEIPVIFSCPNIWEETRPLMKPCIGVSTKQREASKYMKVDHPDGRLLYQGKCITDEDVIAWLEKEDNIESMKNVRELALQYGEECRKFLEEKSKREREQRIKKESEQYAEYLDKEEKTKQLIAKKDELVAKYRV